jgi:elongation factor G
VFCASGLRNIGLQPISTRIVTYVPSPAERPFAARTRRRDRDPRGRQHAPLVSGCGRRSPTSSPAHHDVSRRLRRLKADTTVHNLTRDQPERVGHVLVLQGKTQTHVPELHAGDIGAVAKLKDTHTATRSATRRRVHGRADHVPEPVLVLRDRAEEPDDEDKIGPAMQRLHEEDPSIATRAIRRRTSCCSPARASCTSK